MKWQHDYTQPPMSDAEVDASVARVRRILREEGQPGADEDLPDGAPIPEGPEGAVAFLLPRAERRR